MAPKCCIFAVFASYISISHSFNGVHPTSTSIACGKLTSYRNINSAPSTEQICHQKNQCNSRNSIKQLFSSTFEVEGPGFPGEPLNGEAVELISLLQDISSEVGGVDEGEEEEAVLNERNEQGLLALSAKNIDKRTLMLLEKKGITHMTPIQEESFDPIFEGRDIIGRSRTGTGKTLAFCLPIVQSLVQSKAIDVRQRGRSPRVIILLPTRELAKQVEEQLDAMITPHKLKADCFYGGTSYNTQDRSIREGLDILVATPGRLLDHLKKGELSLRDVRHAVLDEADEMLNMGFADDVEEIFSYFDVKKTQVLLFSATTPPWVAKMAKNYLKNPITIDAVKDNETRLAITVRHIGIEIGTRNRADFLEDIIAVYGSDKRVIVFADTKRDCDDICTHAFKSLSASQLHGDMSQMARDTTLEQFRLDKFQVLVATDVAARGLDITGVDLIIQLAPPRDTDTYVHRSGRTGRAGNLGTNIILHSPSETYKIRQLQQELNFRVERGSLPSTQQVMNAASILATRALDTVDDDVIPFFIESAQDVFTKAQESGGDQAVINMIAKSLAAVSGKKTVSRKSILTGEAGSLTVSVRSDNPMVVGDVFWAVNRISNKGEFFEAKIGKVQSSTDPKHIVFDMSITDAEALIQHSNQNQLQSFKFEITDVLPPLLRPREFGTGGRGRGSSSGRGGRGSFSGRGDGRREYSRSSFGSSIGRRSYGDAAGRGSRPSFDRDRPSYRKEYMR